MLVTRGQAAGRAQRSHRRAQAAALLASLAAPGVGAAQGPAPPAQAAAPPPQAGAELGDLEALLSESVVTTASRSAERASVAPATVFNVTAAEMMDSGMRTVDEALEFLGLGVYVARPRDYATGIDVGAQGLLFRDAGRHVLVMLNGTILNSQGTGRISLHEALGVPLDLIDHIEVMLGPGSVMYGSHAMLAVINVVTKQARDLKGLHLSGELGTAAPQDADGRPTSAPGSRFGLRYRLSLGGGGRFQLRGREGEVTAMLEWTQEESASYGVTPFTMGAPSNQSFLPGQSSWGGDAVHALRAPAALLTLRLGELRLLVNAFHYSRTMPLVGTFNDPYAREQQTGVRLDLRYGWQLSERFRLDSRLYGGYAGFSERSNYGESFWCIAGQESCHMEMTARSGWVGLEQLLSADWRSDGKIVSTLGYDLRPRLFDSSPGNYTDLGTSEPPTAIPLPYSSDVSVIGAIIAQQLWRPLPWLALNAGARLDFDSHFGARLSPRAAVVFSPRATTIRLSYNEAFRAPTLYETTEFDPTYRITPQGLRPETVRSAEVELQQRVARLHLSARAYASFYDDLIESRTATEEEVGRFLDRLSPTVDPTVVQVNDNITSLHVYGGSGAATLQLPRGLFLRGSFNVARAQTPEGEPFDRMPFYFGNFRAGWHGGDDGYSVTVSGVYASSRTILSSSTATELQLGPRLDLRLAAAGPLRLVPGLRFRAAVGFNLNPALPYAITTETDTPAGYVLYPDQPRLFGFLGLQYDYGAR